MKVVGIRTKPDVVVTKIPPHKLFPKTDSCESFTSSEEEGETQGEDNGAHKGGNGKSSKGHHESRKKKKEKDRDQDRNKEESTENHTEENGAETGGIQEAICDTVVNGDKVNDQGNREQQTTQNQEGGGYDIGINAESDEKIIPNGNCDKNSSKQEDSSSVLKGDKSSDMEEPGQSKITTAANKLSLKDTWRQQVTPDYFKDYLQKLYSCLECLICVPDNELYWCQNIWSFYF